MNWFVYIRAREYWLAAIDVGVPMNELVPYSARILVGVGLTM